MQTKEEGETKPLQAKTIIEKKAQRLQDGGKGTLTEDPRERRKGCEEVHGDMRLPRATPASPGTTSHAPMHNDGDLTQTPQTQHVPQSTPRAANGTEHREILPPQQSQTNTNRPQSCNPAHPCRQRPHISKSALVTPQEKRDTTAHSPQRTFGTPRRTIHAHRQSEGTRGDVNTSHI